jgi:hypothetical protein
MICRLFVGFDTILAESEGFEPPELLHSTVFKTAAIDHSANSPAQKYKYGAILQTIFTLITPSILIIRSFKLKSP